VDPTTHSQMLSAESQPRLVMESGPKPGQIILLTQEWLTLGRSSENDVVLLDLEVSRRHASLRQSQRGWMLEDMGSTNGTYVNGARLLAPHLLIHGDVINLSDDLTFTFRHRAPVPTQAIPAYRPPTAAAPPPAEPAWPGQSGTAGWAGAAPPPPPTQPPRRQRGKNPWFIAGVAGGLILGGLLCLLILLYFTLPELSGALTLPPSAAATPPVNISTSVPPDP
jgi:hypothetical protein